MKNLFSDVKRLFNPVEVAAYVILFFSVNFYYFYLSSMNLSISLVIGSIGIVYFFFVYTYQNKKLNNYQDNLNDLLKYVSNMIFYLQSGENVYYALRSTQSTVNNEIRQDIEAMLEKLDREAVLDTSFFEKYEFPTLDQFHQNLHDKYERGGDARELFSLVQQNMVNELKSRDELFRKRKGFQISVFFMIGMVGLTPVLLRFMIPNLWEVFLSYQLPSMLILLINYAAILLNLYFLQKKATDISVRV